MPLYYTAVRHGVVPRRGKTESLYRKAIKITFGLRNNTPNEIVFIESALTELKAEHYKRQYDFWGKILKKTSMMTLYPRFLKF